MYWEPFEGELKLSQSNYSILTITDRMMALKKNGQEQNKLHLPISLDGSNVSHGHSTEVPHVPMSATAMPVVPAEPVEESYMIMNSAHTALSNAGCVPQSDA